MEIIKEYKVYELNNVMGSELEEVEFKGFKSNSFKSEEDAIQAILDDEKTYEDYVILKSVYMRPS